MEIFLQLDTWISLIALASIEIILGVDNLVFIAIITGRLHPSQQKTARRLGLFLAMAMRLALLAIIVWIAGLAKALFSIGHFVVSVHDLIFFFGGLFLVSKATHEILAMRRPHTDIDTKNPPRFWQAITQIIFFDVLFSLDSVITAVGIVQNYWIMALAIIIAVLVMMLASEFTTRLIMSDPRIKILALCILVFVGFKLMLLGLHFRISSAYLFVAMGFAIFIECINVWLSKRQKTSI